MLWSWLSSVPSQGCHRIESLLTHIALFSTDMLIMVFQDLNKSQIQCDWVGAYHCGLVFFLASLSSESTIMPFMSSKAHRNSVNWIDLLVFSHKNIWSAACNVLRSYLQLL